MNTPSMLLRTGIHAFLAQLLVVTVISAAVPDGASMMVLAGFVTAGYDQNIFAIRVIGVPWTDPRVYFTVQTLVQVVAISAAVSAMIVLARTNPWQHGVLPNSTPPRRDNPSPSPVNGSPPTAGAPQRPSAPAPPSGPVSPPPAAPGGGG